MTEARDVGNPEFRTLDAIAATVARRDAAGSTQLDPALDRSERGRLRDLAAWFADAQRRSLPQPPVRVRELDHEAPSSTTAAASVEEGASAVDVAVDSGADLLVLAGGTVRADTLAVVSAVCGIEPVRVLARGSAAVDAATWMAQAQLVRDTRRAVLPLIVIPQQLLVTLGDPALAKATGALLQAANRRTPVVIDGLPAAAAALLAAQAASGASDWLLAADTSSVPALGLAYARLGLSPLLQMDTALSDGTAAWLAVRIVEAALQAPNGGRTDD